jgi:predicted lipoprotein with Yx(FWY)xxD motif
MIDAALLPTAVALLALAAGALAGSGHSASTAAVLVQGLRFGPILFDGRASCSYGFTRDKRNQSTCLRAAARSPTPAVRSTTTSAIGGAARFSARTCSSSAGGGSSSAAAAPSSR